MNVARHHFTEYDDWRGFVVIPATAPVVAGQRITASMTLDDMMSPELDASGETLDLICDLALTRPSYDFLSWLCNADVYRQMHGFAGIRVRFDGPENDFLRQVLRPALTLLPDITEGHDKDEPTQTLTHMPRLACEVYRRTGIVPRLRHPIGYCAGDFVTITLREAGYWESRNSALDAWLAFSKMLPGRVIIVRDFAMADEPIEGFETSPQASRNLHYRMALYERATMNYFVSNGPAILALFTQHVPYVCIMKSPPDCGLNRSPDHFFGFGRGGQFPWATPRQRLVWSEDTLPEIIEAAHA